MFETIQPAPPDAILGLTEAYRSDPNSNKINLGVGVYKDEHGVTPILPSVKLAEQRVLASEESKSYLPIDGSPAYAAATQRLLFGADHEVLTSKRVTTSQTPGGTGALRVAADFIAQAMPGARVWLSDPTWPNHPSIFAAAGVPTESYPYFDAASNGVAFEAMLTALGEIPAGDVLLLHGCCHNPTGGDLNPDQWQAVAELVSARGILPLLDFAYQGFADGLAEDRAGLLALSRPGQEMLVASSYSKNFGLYNERVGALTVVAGTGAAAQAAQSHVKRAIRANYSNPPDHGGAVVTTILDDAELRSLWESEVAEMRDRVNGMRHLFVETLDQMGSPRDFSFITQQRGMFSFSGLTPDQVAALRERHSVYIVGSGRINVAGMTTDNMDALCAAIVDVLNHA